MNTEQEKYARLIISLSTDFLLGKIDFDHYSTTLEMISGQISKLKASIKS